MGKIRLLTEEWGGEERADEVWWGMTKDRKEDTLIGVRSKELEETAITFCFSTFFKMSFLLPAGKVVLVLYKLSSGLRGSPSWWVSPSAPATPLIKRSCPSPRTHLTKCQQTVFKWFILWILITFLCWVFHFFFKIFSCDIPCRASAVSLSAIWMYESLVIIYRGSRDTDSDAVASLHPTRWSPLTSKQCESQGGAKQPYMCHPVRSLRSDI